MANSRFHVVIAAHPYYYNCRECGRPLWTEATREKGYCARCAGDRLSKLLNVKKILIVQPPKGEPRLN
jgi:Zn finger protein HypA/HybF involved in hydrogenase expression